VQSKDSGAVVLMLAFTVIKLLGNILAIYIGCKAIIPVVFSGDVSSLVGMMMRMNFGCIQKYHLKVNLCDGALVTSCYLKLYNVRAGNSKYMSSVDSVVQ